MFRRAVLPFIACMVVAAPSFIRAEDQFFDSNGVKIHYIVEGTGEPVVLIHGFTADIDKNWRTGFATGPASNPPRIFEKLAKKYQVIALDNRGHGKSDKPHDPKQYGIEMVEDVVRLLDHLKIRQAHVVGYSMGGIITAKLLATHPDRLLTATLGGHGGIHVGTPTDFYEKLASSLEQGKGMGPLIERLTPPGRPKPTAEQMEMINRMLAKSNDEKALAAVVRAFGDLTIDPQKLEANQVPTLAIIGELDPLKSSVDALKERMGNLKVVVIDGADHMTAVANPKFFKSLSEYLEQNSSERRLKKAG
jgi:pimeloyl-ACP methyl ester carboxylesterase